MNDKTRLAFEMYMNYENDTSNTTKKAEEETKNLEKEFLNVIGIEHQNALSDFVTNIMCIWLECGFDASYNAKKESH